MTAIIDYGAGNLQSVEKALRHIGCGCTVAADPAGLMSADSAVLPGVGAFGEAMAGLESRGPYGILSRRAAPFWGSAWGCRCCLRAARSRRG